MAEVSTRLRAAREQAGLTLEDISASTKIKLAQLQALERGEFERLPGEFFTRAFIKTYARELGLPANEVLHEYEEGRAAERPADASRPAPEVATAPAPKALAQPREPALTPQRAWPAVAFTALVLLGLFLVNRQPQRAAEPGAVSSTGAPEVAAQPAPTSGPAQTVPDTLSMEIAPTAEIWINASADGTRAVYRLVKAGERLRLEARNDLTFRIGNAAAFEYTINGVPGRPLGRSGEVVEFQINRDNVRTFQR